MENKELIDKLMDGGQQAESAQSVNLPSEVQVEISSARVISIRYKIYVAILLVVIIFGWFDYVQPTLNESLSLKESLHTMQDQIAAFSAKKAGYETDKQLIDLIHAQESTILTCLNTRVGCASIDARLKANNGRNFSIARSYLQLGNLADPKMQINEKTILANINEFLLKDNGSKNGSLQSITLGDPELIKDKLYVIPVSLSVTFASKDMLLSFIDNIEKKVLPDSEYRILYKIKEVGYDIMHYQEQQSVSLSLSAYYYQE